MRQADSRAGLGVDSENPDRPEIEHFGNCDVCGALVDVRDLAQVTAHMHRSRVCARLRERRANIVFNVIGAPAEVEKVRSAIKNDFEMKSIYAPAGSNAAAWRRKHQRASVTGEDMD
jgi:hypothetical protein